MENRINNNMDHPFIELIVKNLLDLPEAKLWQDTVDSAAPSGLPTSIELNKKNSRFYKIKRKKSFAYVIPLTRDLNEDEALAITKAWVAAWDNKKTDFVINFSTKGKQKTQIKKFKKSKLDAIALEAAKLSHTKWYQQQVDDGWGYGPKLDTTIHKHPLLLPWDQLAEKYKTQRIQQFLDLMEVLNQMKLAIVYDDQI
jgi:hypothetical protein